MRECVDAGSSRLWINKEELAEWRAREEGSTSHGSALEPAPAASPRQSQSHSRWLGLEKPRQLAARLITREGKSGLDNKEAT